MLAKIWKKLLLAICIIAILFNITAKLVNRISLEKAISSSPEGVNMRSILNITEEERTVNPSTESHISRYKTVEEVEAERAAQEAAEEEARRQEMEAEEEDSEEIPTKRPTGGQIIDKLTETINDTKKYDNLLN